jgi:hypothetical protein
MPTGTHDLQALDGTPVRKGRVSPALRTAIKLIVEEGLTVADAAIRTGYKPPSLAIALMKPHVKAFRSSVKRAWLASKTERAWLTVADLAERGNSEDVRLKAAKVFIDADEAARATMPAEARQLVQVYINQLNQTGHLPARQMSGVIEAEPYQPIEPHPSNSRPVGRAESGAESDD